jgi:hypothetical protein
LATIHAFEEAVKLRDAARHLQSDDMAPNLRDLDLDFRARWRDMVARHTAEYQMLYDHVNTQIQSLKDRVESRKQAAEAELKVMDAQTAPTIIQTVSEKALSPVAREKIIQSFSPRSKRGSPGSRSSQSRGSNKSGSSGSPNGK